jgi:hypothetical protein
LQISVKRFHVETVGPLCLQRPCSALAGVKSVIASGTAGRLPVLVWLRRKSRDAAAGYPRREKLDANALDYVEIRMHTASSSTIRGLGRSSRSTTSSFPTPSRYFALIAPDSVASTGV